MARDLQTKFQKKKSTQNKTDKAYDTNEIRKNMIMAKDQLLTPTEKG